MHIFMFYHAECGTYTGDFIMRVSLVQRQTLIPILGIQDAFGIMTKHSRHHTPLLESIVRNDHNDSNPDKGASEVSQFRLCQLQLAMQMGL